MPAKTWKEWEQPLLELDDGISKLKVLAARESDAVRRADIKQRIQEFEARRDRFLEVRYSHLGPWEKVLLARADPRPHTLDYVNAVFADFVELEGDRLAGADHALVGGPAFLDGIAVMVIGQQKGRNLQERAYRNFAMMKPDGYRKAMRLMAMADRFEMPVVTFIDTPAADPGVDSESRGIAEAIASSMMRMFELRVPVVCVVIGEGGSGGAMGIAVGNTVLMQEHAIFSVIPPEGCAAILWRKPEQAPEAAAALRLTAEGALECGAIDRIVSEPAGGAHRDPGRAASLVREALVEAMAELEGVPGEELKARRRDKYRKIGVFGQA